jgi:hypothetical protein
VVNHTPRIFVGTLSSGEAEFDSCKAAILLQQNIVIEHCVISGLQEQEAHEALWQTWNKVKDTFDLFVKIDADTVLLDNNALRNVYDLFAADSNITGAQVLLHDYFTDQLIAGMNFFTPQVLFVKAKSRLYCDRADTNHNIVLRGDAVAHLAPIGNHCQSPSPVQAFHFGLHRMLKKQSEIIDRVADVYLTKGGEGRMWALSGAMSASFWMRTHHDYADSKFQNRFEKLQQESNHEKQVRAFAIKRCNRK